MAPARAMIPPTRPPAMGAPVLASVVPEPLIAVAPRVEPLGRVAVAPPTLPLPGGTPPVSPPMLPDGVLFVVIPVLGIVLPALTSVVGALLVVTPGLGPVLLAPPRPPQALLSVVAELRRPRSAPRRTAAEPCITMRAPRA